MLFDTVGQKGNPVVIMLNGSFTSGKTMAVYADRFKDEFYVICPTYDGHYDNGGTFTTRQAQCEKIVSWLKENGIKEVALIQGLSMGAEVALDLAAMIANDPELDFKHAYLDGGPFFAFAKPMRAIMRKKFKTMIHQLQEGGTEALMNNRMVKWMAGDSVESYGSMVDDMPAVYFSDETIENESDACYTFDFPPFDEAHEKRLVFSWSDNEPAHQSRKNIEKHYPKAEYRSAGKLGHGGFMLIRPDEYETVIRNLANQ